MTNETVFSHTTNPVYNICMYVYMHVCIYVCMRVCMYIRCMYVCRMHVHMYICMYVCMYLCLYLCMHVYIYMNHNLAYHTKGEFSRHINSFFSHCCCYLREITNTFTQFYSFINLNVNE